MSADNGYLVRKNSRGKWVAQHYFVSADEWPDVNDHTLPEYVSLEAIVSAYSSVAGETEYGFNIIQSEEIPPKVMTFGQELANLINKYSRENESATPDFILARYLERQLELFDSVTRDRDLWYGRTFGQFGPEKPKSL